MIQKISIDLGDFTPGLFSKAGNASPNKKGKDKAAGAAEKSAEKNAEKNALLAELRTQFKTADAATEEKNATIARKQAIGYYNLVS